MAGRDPWYDRNHVARYGDPEEGVEFEDSTVAHATGKVLLIQRHGKKFWVPKSVITADSELKRDSDVGDTGTLSLGRRWCEMEGLEP